MLRLTRAQVREIDRLALERYGIPGIVLMENAARSACEIAMRMLPDNRAVTIFCGGGNNGGDGLAIARHLHNHGLNVRIVQCFDPAKLPADAATNWKIVQAMKIPISKLDDTRDQSEGLMIDALLGTGATSPPRDSIKQAIQTVNLSSKILAIDLPSGLDADSGEPLGDCVRASKTVTFVAEKIGFANPRAKKFTGEVIVGDIGCPRELIDAVTV
jgi:NAD(P)H-hydrate epimerase